MVRFILYLGESMARLFHRLQDSPSIETALNASLHCLSPYLVGGLEHVLFSHLLGIFIPIDELIFFRGVGQPSTRISLLELRYWTAPSSLPPRVASDWCVPWALALLLWRKPWKSMGLPSSKWVCIDAWGPLNPWLNPHDPHSMAVNGGKPMFRIVQTDSLFCSSNACLEWSCPLLMANLGHQAPPKKRVG